MVSTTKKVNIALNVGAAIGLTIGGASAIPGSNLPPVVLFYGLLFAGICKAVSSTLTQASGDSDEAQGITPTQVAMSQALHDQAKALPAVSTSATTTTITSPTAVVVKTALVLLCLGLVYGCSTSAVTTTAKANAAAVATVDAAMTGWATYTKSHTVPANTILAVANAYNVYYDSELVVSNVLTAYVTNPSTNNGAIVTAAIVGVAQSQSNLLNIVSTFSK